MLALLPIFVSLCAPIRLDPGFMTSGGQPHLLSGKTTVRMTAETVTMKVSSRRVDVEGLYTFENLGKDCSVRMGFPESATFPLQDKKLFDVLAHYKSYVDGKRVTTKLTKGEKMDELWQVQTVSFGKNQQRVLKITYSTSLGAMAARPPFAMTGYVLHTGATWNGPIGSLVIDVRFSDSCELTQPYVIWHGDLHKLTEQLVTKYTSDAHGIIVGGPGEVTQTSTGIKLTAKNFKPGKEDDVFLAFRYPPKQLELDKKKGASTPVVPP